MKIYFVLFCFRLKSGEPKPGVLFASFLTFGRKNFGVYFCAQREKRILGYCFLRKIGKIAREAREQNFGGVLRTETFLEKKCVFPQIAGRRSSFKRFF